MALGDRGTSVKTEQKRLNDLGANLTVDGIWGPLTQAAYEEYGKTGANSSDELEEGPRFADLPGKPEVWKDKTTGDTYMVYFVPDSDPEIPMLWKVSDPNLLKSYFEGDKVTYDRTASTSDIEKAGGLHFGEVDEVVLRGENPFLGWASQFERKREVLPWLNDPEVAALWTSSYLEGRTPDDAELASTDWFKSKTAGEQQWVSLEWSQPETAAQLKASNRIAIQEIMEQSGIQNADESTINYIADQWTQGLWTDVQRNTQIALMADPKKEGERDPGLVAASKGDSYTTTTDQLRFVEEESRRWLGPIYGGMSEKQMENWAGRLRNDPNAKDAFQEYLQGQRMAVMPEYENEALTYEDIANPWRNFATNSWGQRMDETSDTFQQLIKMNDTAEGGAMLRQEGLSQGIKKVEDDFVNSIGRSFGGDGGVRGFGG